MTSAKRTYAVIRAVYDNHHSTDDFERELDFVLTRKVGMVIIEPETLGELTWRWIRTGNWLHKTAVICGMSALATAGLGLTWNSLVVKSSHLLPISLDSHWWLSSVKTEAVLFDFTPRLLRMSLTVLSGISATAAGFYALFWQWDPCCKYQVASSLAALPRGVTSIVHANGHTPREATGSSSSPTWPNPRTSPNGGSSTASNGAIRSRPVIVENWAAGSGGPPLRPVVLVHRDDGRRKLLHNTVALMSTLVTGYVLYQWSRSTIS
ncbi:unnamed protein product [Echinostoma caproni]|uniref:Transmembrane protein 11, mitochondrial n=1 Tax=Echinostoma caproni TaxID=27848 RepID=A0A183AP43_9TREM|nr:unnamed protein product [Echinostoma caproni]